MADISYAQLNGYANQLANVLAAQGIKAGDVVGLAMPNIPQYVIALIALSKMNVIASGVSPLLTANEMVYQIRDANIKTLLILDASIPTSLGQLESLPDCLENVIVASAMDHLKPEPVELPEFANTDCQAYAAILQLGDSAFDSKATALDDTIFIQYTGGTTGKPKGAMLSLRNIMFTCQACKVYDPWREAEEVVASAFPYFHIAGLSFLVSGLSSAGTVILIPDPRDTEYFCQQMLALPPTRFAAVPSLYQMLLEPPLFKKVDFSRLEMAVTGAAPLALELRQKIEALIGENKLGEAFGMTETGPTYVASPPGRNKPNSVGVPVVGADVCIVDVETGSELQPFGETGEIIVSSPQVMKGYLNLPEESKTALRQWQGQTWMYSGDVGYMDEEGYIYLVDRAKDMLIVGGFKVFSVELEDKFAELDFVAQSAVVASPNKERVGNDVVNLFVQLRDSNADKAQCEQQILQFSQENFAPYKVPKKIHFVDTIPLTAIGKVDKKRLREILLAT